jgi:hypothetical protein
MSNKMFIKKQNFVSFLQKNIKLFHTNIFRFNELATESNINIIKNRGEIVCRGCQEKGKTNLYFEKSFGSNADGNIS